VRLIELIELVIGDIDDVGASGYSSTECWLNWLFVVLVRDLNGSDGLPISHVWDQMKNHRRRGEFVMLMT